MPHPTRPGPFQDAGQFGWIIWALYGLIVPEEQTDKRNASLIGVIPSTTSAVTLLPTTNTTNATNTTLPLVFQQHNHTFLPTSTFPPTAQPCVPVASNMDPFWTIFQNILAYILVSWLIPYLIKFFVDVLFAFLEPAAAPTPLPSEGLQNRLDAAETQLSETNSELKAAKESRERADRDLADTRQQLAAEQSFAEEQRSRAEERGKALAASGQRAQELEKANAKLSETTNSASDAAKSASDAAKTARMRFRARQAHHDKMATALAREQQRSKRLANEVATHRDQAGKWRVKVEEADQKVEELQSQVDIIDMQPSEVPDTFRPSTVMSDQLAEAIAARDSTGEKLAAAEEQTKQVQQSKADLQVQLDQTVAAKVETETKANALNNRVTELTAAEQQVANSLATEQERSASFEADKQHAEATAKSLQDRVEELEKSTSLHKQSRADIEAELTSSQGKLADAESTVAELRAQLGEASAVTATSDSHQKLAQKEKDELAAGKAKAERERAAASQSLDLAMRRTAELEGVEREKEAALQRASEEIRQLAASKEHAEQQAASNGRDLSRAVDHINEQEGRVSEARMFREQAEKEYGRLAGAKQVTDQDLAATRQELALANEQIAELTAWKQQQEDVMAQTMAMFGGGEQQTAGNNNVDEYFTSNEDSPLIDPALFEPFENLDDPLPPDFQSVSPPADPPQQAQDEFNFAEPPEQPLDQGDNLNQLLGPLTDWNAAHPDGAASIPPSTVPTSTVAQQNFTVPTPTVTQQPLPAFSFTAPTSTVTQQVDQPAQGGPIFGGLSSDNAPSSAPFTADFSSFATDAHPSAIFGQPPAQAAEPSNSYTRELTDADWADGFAEWQATYGSGNPANQPGGVQHDPGGSGDQPDNQEKKEDSSTESEEE